jgi:hypothetical protein
MSQLAFIGAHMAETTKKEDIQAVFLAWREYQKNPDRCKFTARRRSLITARLREHTAQELVAVVKWVNEADDYGAAWLRGENPQRRQYLDLENLFRASKTAPRVEAALEWADDQEVVEVDCGDVVYLYRGNKVEQRRK